MAGLMEGLRKRAGIPDYVAEPVDAPAKTNTPTTTSQFIAAEGERLRAAVAEASRGEKRGMSAAQANAQMAAKTKLADWNEEQRREAWLTQPGWLSFWDDGEKTFVVPDGWPAGVSPP